jgi:hypothetical protein
VARRDSAAERGPGLVEPRGITSDFADSPVELLREPLGQIAPARSDIVSGCPTYFPCGGVSRLRICAARAFFGRRHWGERWCPVPG